MINSEKNFVGFIDTIIAEKYFALRDGRPDDRYIYRLIDKATDILKERPYYGTQVKKERIPREYFRRYNIENLWRYELSDDWRMVYTVAGDGEILTVQVIEWFDHKEYDKRFGYN